VATETRCRAACGERTNIVVPHVNAPVRWRWVARYGTGDTANPSSSGLDRVLESALWRAFAALSVRGRGSFREGPQARTSPWRHGCAPACAAGGLIHFNPPTVTAATLEPWLPSSSAVRTRASTSDDPGETYETVSCQACRQVHLVNLRTGRVMGGDAPTPSGALRHRGHQ
jgi:hypothetical protein